MKLRLPLAAIAALLVLSGCGSTGVPEAGDAGVGEEVFKQKCGSCHTLAEAGTKGQVGPDLDAAFARSKRDGFDESTLRGVVRNMIEYPVPPMPTREELDITDEQADAIATYVAQVASVPPPEGGGQATGGDEPADGKSIFASAGCGSCHTLADAGSSGTVGPDLDDSSIDVPGAQARITNGGGAMPPFKDTLSDAQIQAVAEYVVSARGG